MTTLSRLARVKGRERPAIVLTTVNAALQRVPPRETLAPAIAVRGARQHAADGRRHAMARAQRLQPRLRRCASPATTRCAAASSICSRRAWTRRCGSISSATRWNRSAASIRRRSAPPTSCARSISCRWRSFSSPPTPSGCSAPAMSRPSARPAPTTCSTKRSAKAAAPPASSTGCRCSTRGSRRCSIIWQEARSRSSRWPKKPPTSGWRRSPTIIRRARTRSTSRAAARPTNRCRRTGSISPKPNGASGSTRRRLRAAHAVRRARRQRGRHR